MEVLFDDRDETAGVKFADADLIGVPIQVIVSDKNIANQQFEVKNRKTGEVSFVSCENVDELIKLYKTLSSDKI